MSTDLAKTELFVNSSSKEAEKSIAATFSGWFAPLGLGAIVLLAGVLRFANFSALGDGNLYYTAGVKSMLSSWHNFFFAAAEPGGSVTIDKPPLGLWIQTLSAAIFGANGFGVILPQILAGMASVVVLYFLVKRAAGVVGGLVAALVLATTPVTIAVDRNNTIDSLLIFTLLLATWAFCQATESGKLKWLLVGAAIVGLAFNIKMLQAYLPVPALYAMYFLGAKQTWRVKFLHLAAATSVLLVVSFSWATIVELTPADQRPYVGSSENNSVYNLIFGYNGLGRLLGVSNGPGGAGGPGMEMPFNGPNSGASIPIPGANGGVAFGFETGEPGIFRLFQAPLVKELSWLLPLALLLLIFGLVYKFSLRLPLDKTRQNMILWGGWLLAGVVFFSMGKFFHAYYLSLLSPALGALIGIGVRHLHEWQTTGKYWLASGVAIAFVVATLGFQTYTLLNFKSDIFWVVGAGILALIGVGLMAVENVPEVRSSGLAFLIASTLLVPTIWAGLTTFEKTANTTLPSAYTPATGERDGRPSGFGPMQLMGNAANSTNAELLEYLQARTQDTKYLVAVPSSMNGAGYVLSTGRPVLYMGGFGGGDKVLTVEKLAKLVETKQLRYVLDAGMLKQAQSEIANWLEKSCKTAEGLSESALRGNFPMLGGGPNGQGFPGGPGGNNAQPFPGAPGGQGMPMQGGPNGQNGQGSPGGANGGGMLLMGFGQSKLYECGNGS